MITENLSTLKIHKLTQEQYDRELAAGNIDESAIYLTPDEGGEEIDLSIYATKEIVESYVDAINNEKESYVNKSTVIDAESTDIQYPSSKAVYDFVNQSEHITKLTATNTYIWDLPPGIYTFTATNRIQRIYFAIGVNYPCDEGAFLIVGGENHSGYLPSTTTFKKSVIFLRNLNATMAQIITGISTVNYTTAEDGKVTYIVEWDGGIIESQDNKTNVVDESVTNDQYPSAKAVYDYGKDIKANASNALKKNASAITNLEITDLSPFAHYVTCILTSKNLSPIEKIDAFTEPTEISLGQTLPAGEYAVKTIGYSSSYSFIVEFRNDANTVVKSISVNNSHSLEAIDSPFSKVVIYPHADLPIVDNLSFYLYLNDYTVVTVTVNNQDRYKPKTLHTSYVLSKGIVEGILTKDSDTNMTISTDIDGIEINVEYNADINSVLPPITESDNGKVLQVVDGKLALVELDYSKIYVGTEEPTSTTSGDENDLYIQLDEEVPTDNEVNNEAPIDDNTPADGEIIDDNTPVTEE